MQQFPDNRGYARDPGANVEHDTDPPNRSAENRIILLVVLGVTGAGKTSFINEATGNQVVIENTLEPGTTELKEYPPLTYRNSTVILVDTPGFDGSMGSDVLLLEKFLQFLRQQSSSGIRLSGILYLHRITDIKMQGSAIKNLRLLQELCGQNFLKCVTFVTTMWENMVSDGGDAREADLKEHYWKDFLEKGAETERYSNASALPIIHRVIDRLLDFGYLQTGFKSNIEQEGVDDKLPLQKTAAGRIALEELRQKLQQEGTKLKKDHQIQRGMEYEERTRLQRMIENREEELDKLKELLAKYDDMTPASPSLPSSPFSDRQGKSPGGFQGPQGNRTFGIENLQTNESYDGGYQDTNLSGPRAGFAETQQRRGEQSWKGTNQGFGMRRHQP